MSRLILLFLALLAWTFPASANEELIARGYRALDAGEFAEAIADLRQALAESPNDLKAHEGLAWAHYEKGDFTEAARYADRRLALAPADIEWRRNWALIVREVPERQAEVLGAVRRWAYEAPADRSAQLLLGRVLAEAGHYAEGRRVLNAIIAAAPDDAEALATLASLELWDQQFETARALLETASAMRPDDEALRQELVSVTREVRGRRAVPLEPTLPLSLIVIFGSILIGQTIAKPTARTHLMMFAATAVLGGVALAWLYVIPLG